MTVRSSSSCRVISSSSIMKLVSRMSGGLSANPLPLLLALLAGVACEGRLELVRQPGLVDELLDLLDLAVRQRVHRIDDDGAGPARLPGLPRAHDRVNDGHEEAQRLARAGAGRDHEALARPRLGDGLRLMAMEPKRRRPEPKYSARRFVEIAGGDQLVNGRPLKEARVDETAEHPARNARRRIADRSLTSGPSDRMVLNDREKRA